MSKLMEQLTVGERRLVVGIAVGMFVFMNYWFVWAHFGDLAREQVRMDTAVRNRDKFEKELRHTNEYQTKITALETGAGESVPNEDQAIDFERYLRRRATESGVASGLQGNSRPITRSNEFFVDQEMNMNMVTTEKNLVDFLASLGASNSLVRVRAMNLKPDASHQQLNATLTILASYQKKNPSPVVVASAATKPTGKPLVPLPTNGVGAPAPGKPGAKTPGRPNRTPGAPGTNQVNHLKPGPGQPNPPGGPPGTHTGQGRNPTNANPRFKRPTTGPGSP